MLYATAALFFSNLNLILIDYCYLQFCKLTDDAFSGKRLNLTVPQIDHQLEQAGLLTDEIRALSISVMDYRPCVQGARNRLVAHTDLKARLSIQPVGAHSEDELIIFLEAIQNYCDAVGNVVGIGPLNFRTQAGKGDVQDLIRTLRHRSPST